MPSPACRCTWSSRAKPSRHSTGRPSTRRSWTCSVSAASRHCSRPWPRGNAAFPITSSSWTSYVFTELSRGVYFGVNKTAAQDGWKDHILAACQAVVRPLGPNGLGLAGAVPPGASHDRRYLHAAGRCAGERPLRLGLVHDEEEEAAAGGSRATSTRAPTSSTAWNVPS